MYFKNQTISRLVLTCIIFLIFIIIGGLALSVNDLFYFRKIMLGQPVPESAHQFFAKKNEIERWVSSIGYLTYQVIFLIWLYRSYKNVYVRGAAEAPYKPGVVPFSYLIPIFNLYAPYQIMKFIWIGHFSSPDQLNKGDRTIKAWWFLTVLIFITSRVAAANYSKAVYANEFTNATYYYIFIDILLIHLLILTFRLVSNISKVERSHQA
jgi:hypothetical protein